MGMAARITALAQAIGLDVKSLRTDKQDTLVSGQNIKTVNGQSLLGEGNLMLGGSEPAIVALGNAGASTAIALQQPGTYDLTLTEPTCTLSFTDVGCSTFTLVLRQGTGANKVVWPSAVKWGYGVPPVLSYTQGHVDVVCLRSLDGLTWLGFFEGGGFQ